MNILWTGEDLQTATGGRFSDAQSILVTGISIDTRTLQQGDLFIALVGDNSDGHVHVRMALDKGAAAVLVHQETDASDPRLLRVNDTMLALQQLARFARARFSGKAIAVTGSVGKTTTKEMLRTALTPLGKTHWSVASYNNHWGVPLTLARLPRDADFCVSEIGMNHPGEIEPLATMVRPEVAIITTIAAAHIGHMGSLDAIALEKSAIISALDRGVAIVPDDAHGQDLFTDAASRAHSSLWHAGSKSNSEIQVLNTQQDAKGSSFDFRHCSGASVKVTLNAPGAHLVRNAALVLGAVVALHGDLNKAAGALKDFHPTDGRGALSPIMGGDVYLLDESYNASSLSVRASLEVLGLIAQARRIAVLGDIRELGDFADTEHLSLSPFVRANADLVFCCGPHMKRLYDTLPPHLQGAWAADAAALAPIVRDAVQSDDTILVKGSFGSRMRDVVACLKQVSGGVQ